LKSAVVAFVVEGAPSDRGLGERTQAGARGIADTEARAEIGVVELASVGGSPPDESHVLVEFVVGECGKLCAQPSETLLDANRRVEKIDARTFRRGGGSVRIVEASEEARIAAIEIEGGD